MKRAITNVTELVGQAKVIMLDIEGTTTSISFVKEELFPYVRREVKSYLQETWDEEQTKEDVALLIQQIQDDVDSGVPGMEACANGDNEENRDTLISSLVSGILAMMDADRKIGPLKRLQGHMWKKAYEDGTIKGHVYEDVLGALEEWKAKDKQIVIYSSGSVQAQKLLFGNSCYGDLLQYFSHHFDTSIGLKVEAESYRNILQELDCKPKDVLFVTDLPKEAYAAKEAGVSVILSVREGTVSLSAEDMATFPHVTSFTKLLEDPDQISGDTGTPSRKKSRSQGHSKNETNSSS